MLHAVNNYNTIYKSAWTLSISRSDIFPPFEATETNMLHNYNK